MSWRTLLLVLSVALASGPARLWADVKARPEPAPAPQVSTEAAPTPDPFAPASAPPDKEPAPADSHSSFKPSSHPDHLDPKIKVTKIHEVRNDESYKAGNNDALVFEKKYWNYGAITKEELEARRGQIFVISWKNGGVPARLTARFEYRQVKTKDMITSQTVQFDSAHGNERAIFKVIGDEYRKNGPVYSWRFSVLRDDEVVAVERSYIW